MNKITIALVSFLLSFFSLSLLPAQAAVDNIDVSITAGATIAATGTSYVIRGELLAVKVVTPATATGTVTVLSGGYTAFSKAGITAGTNWFFPRAQIHNTSGVAQTSPEGTNSIFGMIPLADVVIITVTKTDLATNTWTVTPIFNQ
jgi:hypothetical protein